MLKHLERHFKVCASQNLIFATVLPEKYHFHLGVLADGSVSDINSFLPWGHIDKWHGGWALQTLALSCGCLPAEMYTVVISVIPLFPT